MQNHDDRITDLSIEEEMKSSYLTFALSVIVSRALPDVRDGLKPVQRRILMSMNDLNLGPRSQHRKCGKIVGDTLGNYHPHGDQAVYMALVRMGQSFNFRYPLVDGQGNFGSVDGDPPAAMRYTEARSTSVATEMLTDLNLDTVDFIPNYDETRQEPTVLPGKFPNLLCNGSSGIAVGMATSIPPHNANEVCDAIIKVIDDPAVTIDELMKIVKAPDFPSGGLICGLKNVREGYKTGRGSVTMRAVAHIETNRTGKKSIVFTELPYMASPDRIVAQVAAHVKAERLSGISDVRNESDQDGTRVVVDVKKDQDENVLLNQLYKRTQLQDRMSMIMIALVNGRPQTLSLKDLLVAYKSHRVEVIRRRTRYLLNRAEERAHIVEGLLIALQNIDEVIRTIKESKDTPEANRRLQEKFDLTEAQATAILQMRLQQLTGLEQDKLEAEHKELMEKIANYRAILADENLVLDIIREDLYEIKEKFGDKRRSEIVGEVGDFNVEDLIADEMVAVVVSHEGYIKRQPVTTYRKQQRGGKGITAAGTKEGDFVEHLFIAATLDYILFFTDQGRLHWLKVYDLPEMSRSSRGRAIVNMLELQDGEKITNMMPVRDFTNGHLLMATEKGIIKKTVLSAFSRPKKGGIIAINVKEGDRLVSVRLCHKEQDVILATRKGRANRFKDSDVRAMGRTAAGVIGIKFAEKGDKVVGMVTGEPGVTLLTLCENGFGKRTDIDDYRLTKRGSQGVINIRANERNGEVVGVLDVRDDDEVMMVTKRGMLVRTSMENVRSMGRATQGVKLISLREGDHVVAMARVLEEDKEAAKAIDADPDQAPFDAAETDQGETSEESTEGNEAENTGAEE